MDIGVRAQAPRRFYMWMSGACLAVAVLGFMPTYFLPMARGRLDVEPIVHIHGVVLFSWVLLFWAQTWLVARGQVALHRAWGMLGVAIVTAMVFIVTTIVSLRIIQASVPGQPAALTHQVRAFTWVSVSALLFFVPVFILAIVNVRRPEVHKRLMLLGTISLLGAPIARWFMTFLAPPAGPPAPHPANLPVVGEPPIGVAVPPSLVGDILWVVAMIYDWRTRGRPHPVYLIGGAIMLALQVTMPAVGNSDLWQACAAAIGHLPG